MPWPFHSPAGGRTTRTPSGHEHRPPPGYLPVTSAGPTHAVVVSYEGHVDGRPSVYRGSYEQCREYIRTHTPPPGCAFDIMSIATRRLVSYVVEH